VPQGRNLFGNLSVYPRTTHPPPRLQAVPPKHNPRIPMFWFPGVLSRAGTADGGVSSLGGRSGVAPKRGCSDQVGAGMPDSPRTCRIPNICDTLQVLRSGNAKIFDNSFRVKVFAFVRLGRCMSEGRSRGFPEKSRRRTRERRGGFPCVWRPAMTSSCMELYLVNKGLSNARHRAISAF